MTVQYLQYIHQGQLTETDIRWLAKTDGTAYDGLTGEEIVKRWLAREVHLWRFVNGPQGVMTVSLLQYGDSLSLHIEQIAGLRLMSFKEVILNNLWKMVEEAQCSSVTCAAKLGTRVKILTRLGFGITAVQMRLTK